MRGTRRRARHGRTVVASVVVCAAPLLVAAIAPAPARGHDDVKFEQDNQDPYPGAGWRASEGGEPAVAFPSSGVVLKSWVTLDELAPGLTDGSDCWGYTSPSGREYALIGTNAGLGVVEVTDPANAQVVAHVAGPPSFWRDVKTYEHYAYVVSEGGDGIQVFDLADVDDGNVVHVRDVLLGGVAATHNVAVNASTGRVYRAGGGNAPTQGIRIYHLKNPDWPAPLGEWHDRYCHDVQAVSWRDGPFKGHEIVFCYAENTSGSGEPGLDVLDATDPQNVTVVGSIDLTEPPIFSHPASYSHQGWLSYDYRYVYLNDEVDEQSSGQTTTTRILDVQDLTNPHQVAIFQNTSFARDHNLYTHGKRIFQANYRAGLRILDASDPLALEEIAYFDTYPANDGTAYNGLWSVYPYFASGTIIGSDIEKGLFVWTLAPNETPALQPSGLALLVVALLVTAARRLARAPRRAR